MKMSRQGAIPLALWLVLMPAATLAAGEMVAERRYRLSVDVRLRFALATCLALGMGAVGSPAYFVSPNRQPVADLGSTSGLVSSGKSGRW